MLHSAKQMKGWSVVAADGKVGSVDDLYFDDTSWAMRYLVVDAGGWLTGRRVLISPLSVAADGWRDKEKTLHLTLTQQQIKDSPGIDTHKPVSRQHEADIYRHYGYPEYWSGPYLWGYSMLPGLIEPLPLEEPQRQETREQMKERGNEIHLRSSREVIGYDIRATDDRIGHVDDFLFDERDWSIRLMVVDTRNWWPGKHVLVAPQRIEGVDWEAGAVNVRVTRAELEGSPEYDSMNPPQSEQPKPQEQTQKMQEVYRHFDRPPEWP